MTNMVRDVFRILLIVSLAIFLYGLLFTGFDTARDNIGKPIDEQTDSSLVMVDGVAPRGGLLESAGRVVILNSCLAYDNYILRVNTENVMNWDDGKSSCTINLTK